MGRVNIAQISGTSNYFVDENGNIYRKLKPYLNPRGYLEVKIKINGKIKGKRVHALVLESFIGQPKFGEEVDHFNRDKYDNRLENLRYVTPKENNKNRKFKIDRLVETDEYKEIAKDFDIK